ncbi:MAG: hypothetical protein D6725_16385 [Planctomycetota bacterium]|nr:MAG: hypothetical protein D6725_16385 [Planctomycetota bacterium]
MFRLSSFRNGATQPNAARQAAGTVDKHQSRRVAHLGEGEATALGTKSSLSRPWPEQRYVTCWADQSSAAEDGRSRIDRCANARTCGL